MIHWDDLDDGFKPAEHVWIKKEVRLLIHKEALTKPLHEQMELALDVDVMGWFQLGEPFKCHECGWTAIDTFDKYPWGQRELGAITYCPHCDGGEDV
jgi:hypothetical protein